jgi:hypothetical protein
VKQELPSGQKRRSNPFNDHDVVDALEEVWGRSLTVVSERDQARPDHSEFLKSKQSELSSRQKANLNH